MSADFYQELEWRGLVHQVTDPELPAMISKGGMTFYCGFDPSADSLTIGNLVQLVRLKRLQRAGHTPIALIGGGTGLIGDPSGKEEERLLLSEDQVLANVASITEQVTRFIDTDGPAAGKVLNNATWLTELKFTDFLRDIGKHFSVNMMIAKESVRARLNEREQGISYTEFSYMLLQSYDFLHLFDHHGCRMQIGGSDQWGNIVAGVDLIRKLRREPAYGFTCPLLEKADGGKFGKTESGSIWLSASKTSPYRFYQFWINTDDRDVGKFVRTFTFFSKAEIEELEAKVETQPAAREAQRALAFDLTTQVHGEHEARRAVEASAALFGTEIAALDEATLLDVLADAPSSGLPRSELGEKLLVDLLVEAGLANSRAAAKTDIAGGGIYLNNVRRTDPDHRLSRDDLLHDKYVVLRRGKRTWHILTLE